VLAVGCRNGVHAWIGREVLILLFLLLPEGTPLLLGASYRRDLVTLRVSGDASPLMS
jgi:hypothetical protein